MPLVKKICNTIERRRNQFRYDKWMFNKDGFREDILHSWSSFTPSIPLNSQIRSCRQAMANWKKRNRTNAVLRISELKTRLDQACSDGNISTMEIHCIRDELRKAYNEE